VWNDEIFQLIKLQMAKKIKMHYMFSAICREINGFNFDLTHIQIMLVKNYMKQVQPYWVDENFQEIVFVCFCQKADVLLLVHRYGMWCSVQTMWLIVYFLLGNEKYSWVGLHFILDKLFSTALTYKPTTFNRFSLLFIDSFLGYVLWIYDIE